jgi:predicted anti-sigma-YlaC factor YlaD
MLTCKEISRTIASDELATAGWRRRLSVRLHLLMCRHCRRYFRQMREIGTAARRIFGEERPDPDSQEQLRSSILGRIPPSGKDAS